MVLQVYGEISRLNWEAARETRELEDSIGEWNSRCSGDMRRYREEHQWRKRLSGPVLTLICES